MLSNGSSGDEVRELQESLAALGFDPGGADGIYGPKTEAAVRAFQEAHQLDVDGIYGPKSAAALASAQSATRTLGDLADDLTDKFGQRAAQASDAAEEAGGDSPISPV